MADQQDLGGIFIQKKKKNPTLPESQGQAAMRPRLLRGRNNGESTQSQSGSSLKACLLPTTVNKPSSDSAACHPALSCDRLVSDAGEEGTISFHVGFFFYQRGDVEIKLM